MPLSDFFYWIWRGKSAKRALLNIAIKNKVKIKGITLDLGGKNFPSYHDILFSSWDKNLIVMDILPGNTVSVLGDLVSTPFKDNSIDTILCFNVLEHVYDFQKAFQELYRILNTGGTVYGYVPFLCQVHSDPYDYWRYTEDCLKNLLKNHSLSLIHLEYHGGPFLSCFDLIPFHRLLKLIRVLLVIPFLFADILTKKIKSDFGRNYPLGYFFIAQKVQ